MNLAIHSTPELAPVAQRLSNRLGLPVAQDNHAVDYLLLVTPGYIGLLNTKQKNATPFYIDFLSDGFQHRLKQASLKKELIGRAIGVKPRDNPTIVDATAGLGRDGFILAALGFQVTLIERSPIIHILLQDALLRAAKVSYTSPIVDRIRLIEADATLWLAEQPTKPDVIYLDPMFPERKKSALVKKEAQVLQDMLGKDTDSDSLFIVALEQAQKRIVVKRPRLAPTLGKQRPAFVLTGRSSRFDIYLV